MRLAALNGGHVTLVCELDGWLWTVVAAAAAAGAPGKVHWLVKG